MKRGYRRPALVLSSALSKFLHYSWWTVFMAYVEEFEWASIYTHPQLEINSGDLSRWAVKEKADVLIYCISENFIPPLKMKKSSKTPAVVCMDLLKPDCGLAGVYQNRRHGGAVAVE